jgi:hypothetical protein
MLRRIPLTGPLLVSLVLIVLATLAVVSHLPALLRAAVAPGPAKTDPAVVVASLLRDHDEDFQRYQDRFNGRSLFYKPQVRRRPPPPRAAPPPRQQPIEPLAPPEPTIPDTYTGPSVLFMLAPDVWFKPLRVGEPPLHLRVGEEKEGVSLISISPPWAVRVGYAGGEYDVTVFERGTDPGVVSDSDPAPPRATSTSIPGLIDEPRAPVVVPGDGDQAPDPGDADVADDGTAEQPETIVPMPPDGDDEPAPAEGGAGEETEETDDGGPAGEPAPVEEPTEQDAEDGVEESGGEPLQDDADDDADDDDPRPASGSP